MKKNLSTYRYDLLTLLTNNITLLQSEVAFMGEFLDADCIIFLPQSYTIL